MQLLYDSVRLELSFDWSKLYKLNLNTEKYNVMSSYRRKSLLFINYILNSKILVWKDGISDLGTILDS